jgi:hypothetical protein
MKKSTLRITRKILGVYCILAILIFVSIKIYVQITGYTFIYYGYSPLLIAFIIYPCILWGMIRLMTLKSMVNNRTIIATLTTAFTVVIMGLNGVIMLLGSTSIEIIEKPNEENTIYVTESAFLHSSTKEYTQKNIFFMEYVDTVHNQ